MCDLVQSGRILCSGGPGAWCSALLEAILKFLTMFSFSLSFVREIQWDNGAGMCMEEIGVVGLPAPLPCCFVYM